MAVSRSLPSLAIKTSSRPAGFQAASGQLGVDSAAAIARIFSDTADRPVQLLLAGFEALDLVNIGVVVADACGKMLLANETAKKFLDARDGIALSPQGTLRASGACGAALSGLLRQFGGPGPRGIESGGAVLAVPRASGRRPLTLLVRSVEAPSREDSGSPRILVFILDPEIPVETAETELRQLYGLTSTEACLANLLMEGRTLDDCCEVLGIRRSTARTHLQHLFEKLGVQRQSELVSLLLKSIGLVRTRGKEVRTKSFFKSILKSASA
jgi:DNA-binding CsgD family transcriptional regulator